MANDPWTPYVPDSPGSYAQPASNFYAPASEFSAPPPNGPKEIEERTNGWAKVQAFMQNPDMQQGLLRMGLMMMQPIPVGQTPLGHAAASLGSSIDYLGAIQQARLQQQLRQAQTQGVQAQTARTQAETEQVIPAQVGQIRAGARLTTAQAERAEQILPTELKQKVAELALLDARVKDAPVESMILEAKRRREELDLLLEEMYGSEKAEFQNQVLREHARYYAALSSAQNALADKLRTEGESKTGWTLKSSVRDEETGTINVTASHKDGRVRLIAVEPAASLAQAKERAKQEIKALSSEEFAGRFPGLSKDMAINELAKQYTRQRTSITDIDPASGVMTRGGGGGLGDLSTGAPSARQAVPAKMQNSPEGTIGRDSDNNWWVKRGGTIVPATADDMAKAGRTLSGEPLQKKEVQPVRPAGAVEPSTKAPSFVSPEVAQRYKKSVVRGSPGEFDYTSYNADMKELQDLIGQIEKGDVSYSIGIARVKLLSHKLGLPEPDIRMRPQQGPSSSNTTNEEKKNNKFSFRIRRGEDGKISALDVENLG